MTFTSILISALAVLLCLIIFGILNAHRGTATRNRQLEEIIQPAIDAVSKNLPSARELVANIASLAETRNLLFIRLKEIGKESIFPAAYRTIEKIAESDLAIWLMHPNELRAVPDEMECVRILSVQENEKSGKMLLFRFRTVKPHWASESGWMSGIAGPYWDGDRTSDFAEGTFSELTPFDKMTEDQHLEFLIGKLKNKGLVVRC